MKMHYKAAAGAAAILLALAAGNANADSSYGASANGGATVSATASVKINVSTPKLIVLRVGDPSTRTVLNFDLTASIATTPSPLTTLGNNRAANWDGTAPTFALTTPVGAVAAYLWHNNNGDAQLTCNATTPFTSLAATDVLVASDLTGGNDLAHPGADTGCTGTTNLLARNTVHTGSWTYSLKSTALTNSAGGNDSEVVTYTATTL